MAAAPTPMLIPTKAQEGFLEFYNQCSQLMLSNWNLRSHLTYMDRLYQRELDLTKEHRRAQLTNKYGDSSRFQNLTVPVVLSAVETAVTYQTSVFLTGAPLFGVVSDPIWIDQAKQLETIIDNQATRGGWATQLMRMFRDGFKYNLACIEVPYVSEVVPTFQSVGQLEAQVKEEVWRGNAIRCMDLYNTFWDTRVPPTQVAAHGEFAGYTESMSRIAFKAFIARLPTKILTNVKTALESGTAVRNVSSENTRGFYVPEINSGILKELAAGQGEMNWAAWVGIANSDPKIEYKNNYEVTTLYARILPSDFGLRVASENTPQIWKLIIVNHKVLLYAERQTNAHNLIPMLFSQPYEDGLGYQTKSMAENVEPIQSLSSALWNSALAARRRAISDRGIYDPSRIAEAHINNPNPAAKIPLRPAGYGHPPSEAYYPIPFRDDQSGLAVQEAQQLLPFANSITGQNPVRQGQFVKGNKTQREFETVMGNANGRDQTISIQYETQLFTPLKHILKTNILQFQTQELLLDKTTGQSIKIEPEKLRKAVMEFKVSDGLIPSDKIISADTWSVAVQTIGTSPQIGAGYNLAPAFSYLMKTQGADLRPFEKSPEQLAYEQALATWQQTVTPALEKGVAASQLPPQPTPEQYGYTPGKLQSTGGAQGTTEVATRVNNITNNITNSGDI